nr:MAG TPA: N-terminal TM domain of oligopeptide transport permease C [Caudoviricetes sp.]
MREASNGLQRILHRLARGRNAQVSAAIIIFVILVGIVWACYDDFPD